MAKKARSIPVREEDSIDAERPDKLSELAKLEFQLEKIEERYRETQNALENGVRRHLKGLSLQWIEVEDALKQ